MTTPPQNNGVPSGPNPYEQPAGLNQPNPEPQGYQAGQVPPPGAPVPPVEGSHPSAVKTAGRGLLTKVLSTLLPILLLVGGIAVYRMLTGTDDPKVGECVVMDVKANDDASHKKVKCDDTSKMTYKVGAIVEGNGSCPSDNYAQYKSLKKKGGDVKRSFCLIPNFQENKCYDLKNDMFEPAASCSGAELKVTKKVDKGDATCSDGEEALSYPQPAPGLTYCLAPAS